MKKFKMIIDILLLLDTILLLDIDTSGRLFHEIFGIVMAILLLVHIVLNWNWIKNITKNFKKVNKKTKFMYVVNLLTAIIYLGAIIFGVIISNELFKFKTASNYKLILTHIIFGRLAIIIMFLHIGMHFRKEKNKNLTRHSKQSLQSGTPEPCCIHNKKLRNIIYVIYIIIAIVSSIYSIYALTHNFWWMMTFGGGF